MVCALALLATAASAQTVLFPGVQQVRDAVYSEQAAVVVLLLEDRLLRYDPGAGGVSFIPLPHPPLGFSELGGELAVGFEHEIYRIDLRRFTVEQVLESPVAAGKLVLGSREVYLLHEGEEREGLFTLPFAEGASEEFLPLRLDYRPTLERGEGSLYIFARWSSTMGFRQFPLGEWGRPSKGGCEWLARVSVRHFWLRGEHLFVDTGHKFVLEPVGATTCERGKSEELEFSARLPVIKIATLCAQPGYVALVQDPSFPRGSHPMLTPAEEAAPDRGSHVEIFSDPLPKRLAGLPLPALQGTQVEPSWGRYVFCDGPGHRLFVILQDGNWKDGRGRWGITTIDLTPLQDKLDRSKAWSELIR